MTAIHSTDTDGTSIVTVTVNDSFRGAKLFADDFARLVAAGIGLGWRVNFASPNSAIVTGDGQDVAQLILQAPPGATVVPLDADCFNLRRDNLFVVQEPADG